MSDQKYCHSCGVKLGYFGMTLPTTFTGTQYQFNKFIKHITVPAGEQVVSVEKDPDYQSYHDGILDTTASGFVHIDSQGVTLAFYVGQTVGVTYSGGVYVADNNARKVVIPYNPNKIHSYTVASGRYEPTDKCDNCGCDLFDYPAS